MPRRFAFPESLSDCLRQLLAACDDCQAAPLFHARLLVSIYAKACGMWSPRLPLVRITEPFRDAGNADPAGRDGAAAYLFDRASRARPWSAVVTARNVAPLLAYCDGFPWAQASPSSVATYLASFVVSAKRRPSGQHYTDETVAGRVIDGLFFAELTQQFVRSRTDAGMLASLAHRLAAVQVLDPACGCGNFLLVAMGKLYDLARQITREYVSLCEGPSAAPQAAFPLGLPRFVGIELHPSPACIARLMLHLLHARLLQPPRDVLVAASSPTTASATAPMPAARVDIHVTNALTATWSRFLAPTRSTYVLGNPPFVGARRMSQQQKADIRAVWGKAGADLDYATAWFKKSVDYFDDRVPGAFAFVATSSIVQGAPVRTLFEPLFGQGWRIRFAYRPFRWFGDKSEDAGVYCVIVGFDKAATPAPRLYPSLQSPPDTCRVESINAYLIAGPQVLVAKRSVPLSRGVAPVHYGSMPNDGGALIVTADQYHAFAADPVARAYLRPFPGALELLHGRPRWCLWLVDLQPEDVARSALLAARIDACQRYRLASRRPATRRMARRPHLFGEIRQPNAPYLAIPRHVSCSRSYFLADWHAVTTIAADSTFSAVDPDGCLFGVISSSLFHAWLQTIGGRLANGLRFSASPVWNNLPLPPLPPPLREDLARAAQGVLAARRDFPTRSLAQLYEPGAVPAALRDAHERLDRIVDSLFGCHRTCPTLEERQAALFRRYAEMSG